MKIPYAYATVVAIVTGCTVLNWALSWWLQVTDLAMVYLLGVVVSAIYFPWQVSIVSSALSLAAFDFFFVPPVYTLRFGESNHFITGLVLFAVGIITSVLAARVRLSMEHANRAAMDAKEQKLRNSLLASLSHDLRTPLAVIAGSASTLRENRIRLSNDEQDQLLDAIYETSHVMSLEVSDILEMTRLQTGRVTVNKEWHPIEELVGAAIERCKRKLTAHNIKVDISADVPMLYVDDVLIEKLLVNLIENAVRYTPSGTHIGIVARCSAVSIEIAIEDNGPGLPAGFEETLFDKFVRESPEGSKPGSGLGLAICRAIAELHRGTISARNLASGGAQFVLSVPLVPPPKGQGDSA